MTIRINRRNFVLGGAAATAATLYTSSKARSAGEPRPPVLLVIFLRGGADGLSMMIPNKGAGRVWYDDWRPAAQAKQVNRINIPPSSSQEQGRGIALGSTRFDTHPAMQPLVDGPFAAQRLAFIGGLAGPTTNRSHFQQMDLIESGAPSDAVLPTGYLSRAIEELGLEAEPLAGLALNPTVPSSLRGNSTGIAISDFESYGNLSPEFNTPSINWPAELRLRHTFGPACNTASAGCAAAKKADAGIGIARDLADAITFPQQTGLLGMLLTLAEMIAADTAGELRMCTLDVGGWDHHENLRSRVAGSLGQLATALTAFDQQLVTLGIDDRVTTVCHSEFGRRADQNGTGGVDHGRGGVGLVLDHDIVQRVVAQGYFPKGANHNFYSGFTLQNMVVPKKIDIRQVLGEALVHRMELPPDRLGVVFPSFSLGTERVLNPPA